MMTIDYFNRSISASPFLIKTYDASKVIVISTPFGSVGKPVEFIVDASNSGEGNLEISVTTKGKNIQTQVQPLGGAKFRVIFIPADISDHIVAISFNNEPVSGIILFLILFKFGFFIELKILVHADIKMYFNVLDFIFIILYLTIRLTFFLSCFFINLCLEYL